LGEAEDAISKHGDWIDKGEIRVLKLESDSADRDKHRETQIASNTALQVSVARLEEAVLYIKARLEKAYESSPSRRK